MTKQEYLEQWYNLNEKKHYSNLEFSELDNSTKLGLENTYKFSLDWLKKNLELCYHKALNKRKN